MKNRISATKLIAARYPNPDAVSPSVEIGEVSLI
jgi:hypothetical protein